MRYEDNSMKFMEKLRMEMAGRLLQAANKLASNLRKRLSIPNPGSKTPSKPGEYPKIVTGKGRAGVTVVPTSKSEIVAARKVSIGFDMSVEYMSRLELRRQRLGVTAAYKETLPEIIAALAGR